jgi:ribosome-binding protein aMBF1 (putative translation factor)
VRKGDHSMAAKKVGVLIKEARTNAGLTQAQLAAK